MVTSCVKSSGIFEILTDENYYFNIFIYLISLSMTPHYQRKGRSATTPFLIIKPFKKLLLGKFKY